MHTHLKIKRLRELRNYSQEYLAAQLEISQQTYSRLERGSSKVKLDRLQKIVDILEFDLIDFIKLPLQAFEHEPQKASLRSHPSPKASTKMEVKLDLLEQELQEIKRRLLNQ